MHRARVVLLALCAAGCVAGRTGMSDGDGSIARMDASLDGSSRDGGRSEDAGGDRDGGGSDGSLRPDGSHPLFEADCDDGLDADGDGLSDCADPDCDGALCDDMGSTCVEGTCGECVGASAETVCGDGVDEDCDGMTDCADPECAGAMCGSDGSLCTSGSCPCPSGFTERVCGDAEDDDCDSLTDCADPACEGRPCAGAGGMVCMTGACVCSASIELCNDLDEDCDSMIDDGCPRALGLCCATSAGSYGGTGGTAFVDPCPVNTLLMGIAGRASTRVDALQPICAALVLDTDRSARPEYAFPIRRGTAILGATHGGSGGTAFDDRCPGNDVVIGVRVTTDALGTRLGSVSLQCGTVTAIRTGASWALRITPTIETPVRGGAAEMPYVNDCTDGAVTEVSGRASTIVDRVGFTCQRVQLLTL